MSGAIRVGGVWKTLTGIQIRVGGVWKTVTRGQIRVGGVWKEFYAPDTVVVTGLTLTGSATLVKTKTGTSLSSVVTTSAYGGVTVTGNTGAVTYSWSRYSAADVPSGGFTCSNTTSATPTFSGRVWDANGSASEVWRLTATDSIGQTGTKDVTVTLSYTQVYGGGIIP